MSVTTDIARSYRAPRQVIRRKLAEGVREDRALVYLMLACLLIFVGQWPRLAREAHLEGAELPPKIGAALLVWVFAAPLFFYALAGLQHLVARVLKGQGTGYSARLALFWSLLAVAPLWLLYGLVQGLVARPGPETLVGLALVAGFAWLWGNALRETETSHG